MMDGDTRHEPEKAFEGMLREGGEGGSGGGGTGGMDTGTGQTGETAADATTVLEKEHESPSTIVIEKNTTPHGPTPDAANLALSSPITEQSQAGTSVTVANKSEPSSTSTALLAGSSENAVTEQVMVVAPHTTTAVEYEGDSTPLSPSLSSAIALLQALVEGASGQSEGTNAPDTTATESDGTAAASVTEAEDPSVPSSLPTPPFGPGSFNFTQFQDLINQRAPGSTPLPPLPPGASADETLVWLRGALGNLTSTLQPLLSNAPSSTLPTYHPPQDRGLEGVDEIFDLASNAFKLMDSESTKRPQAPAPSPPSPPAVPSAPSTSAIPEPPRIPAHDIFLSSLTQFANDDSFSIAGNSLTRAYQGNELFLRSGLQKLAEHLQGVPEDDESYVLLQSVFGLTVLHLYEVTWDRKNLDMGVLATSLAWSKIENPMEAGHMVPTLSRNWAYGQRLLAQVTGDTNKLSIAVTLLERIYDIVADMVSAPERARRFLHIELASCLFEQFLLLEDLADLDSAIAHFAVLCEGDDVSSDTRTYLGHAHLQRYLAMGTLDDLDRAIYHATIAGASAGTGAGNDVPGSNANADLAAGLHLSALCLEQKFHLQLDFVYLDKSIEKLRSAIELLKEENPLYTRVKADLATFFLLRFDSTADSADLENAKNECLVAIAGGGHERNTQVPLQVLWGLILVLSGEDVEEGVRVIARARKEFSGPKNVESRIEEVLSRALLCMYRKSKLKEDLEDAVKHARLAFTKARETAPRRAELGVELGRLLMLSHEEFMAPTVEEAIKYFISAAKATDALATVRFQASTEWANAAERRGSETYVEALECGLDLLPTIAWAGNRMPVQYRVLSAKSSALASRAAAYAIEEGHLEKAVEYLERGRNVIWTQALQFHGGDAPMKDLSEEEYLKRYLSSQAHDDVHELTREQVAEGIERLPPAAVDTVRTLMGLHEEVTRNLVRLSGVDRVRRDYAESAKFKEEFRKEFMEASVHHAATRWEELKGTLQDVQRTVSGELDWLEDEKLVKILEEGPVVLINAYGVRCDAVIVSCRPGGNAATLRHVTLPEMSGDMAQAWAETLREGVYYFGLGQMKRKEFEADVLVPVLQGLWRDMVYPILESMRAHGEVKERVWWYPTGALAFLPIHAAGPYEGDEPGLMDMLASSYIPTVNSLIRACNAADEPLKFLAVGMPETAGMGSLPNVVGEITAIQKHFNDHPEKITTLNSEDATIHKVSKALSEHTWLHFACHADQDDEYPFHSAFFMHDGPLKLSKLMRLDLSRVQFAYLSACLTAAGDAALPDECIHLAAGMQFSGVRSVIATMWSVMDEVAVRATRRMYHHLWRSGLDGQVDSRGGAKALRLALLDMKKNKVPLAYRVAFIHTGM